MTMPSETIPSQHRDLLIELGQRDAIRAIAFYTELQQSTRLRADDCVQITAQYMHAAARDLYLVDKDGNLYTNYGR